MHLSFSSEFSWVAPQENLTLKLEKQGTYGCLSGSENANDSFKTDICSKFRDGTRLGWGRGRPCQTPASILLSVLPFLCSFWNLLHAGTILVLPEYTNPSSSTCFAVSLSRSALKWQSLEIWVIASFAAGSRCSRQTCGFPSPSGGKQE